MAISENIKREHVLKAILHIDEFGIPERKMGRIYFLMIGTRKYPVNETICIANFFSDGELIIHNPSDFNSIQAVAYLRNLDFIVDEVDKNLKS